MTKMVEPISDDKLAGLDHSEVHYFNRYGVLIALAHMVRSLTNVPHSLAITIMVESNFCKEESAY